jgi:hypothetical protein
MEDLGVAFVPMYGISLLLDTDFVCERFNGPIDITGTNRLAKCQAGYYTRIRPKWGHIQKSSYYEKKYGDKYKK